MNEGLATVTAAPAGDALRAKMAADGVDVFYGAKQALKDVAIDIAEHQVTALIGRRSQ